MLDMTKPHKGSFYVYKKLTSIKSTDDLGYFYTGKFFGHPRFDGERGHISRVVKEEGDEVETLNSRYTLIR